MVAFGPWPMALSPTSTRAATVRRAVPSTGDFGGTRFDDSEVVEAGSFRSECCLAARRGLEEEETTALLGRLDGAVEEDPQATASQVSHDGANAPLEHDAFAAPVGDRRMSSTLRRVSPPETGKIPRL
jgi:hypothetical protein